MQTSKVLIISGLPFRNDSNLGKTLSTMFGGFRPEELAQLYFSPQKPNVKICSSYYQVNEKQLLYSFGGLLEKKNGRVINSSEISEKYEEPESNPSAILSIRHYSIIPLLRDVLWLVSKWKTKKLKKWLSDVNPDCVFCTLPNTVRSCKIVNYVAERCDCPVILFVTDDYYNDPNLHSGFIRSFYYHWLQLSIDSISSHLKYVVGCSEMAAQEFGNKYKVPYEAVFTPSGLEYTSLRIHHQSSLSPVIFRYFGNLGLERWKPLKELGLAISDYNNGENKAILEVYSNNLYPDAIAQLDIPNGCIFKGWVHGEEYLDLLESADVAVHVESFSEEMCRRTRLSISTKIADYLGAGKCILAIGRQDLASIQHLKNVACVANDLHNLQGFIKRLVEDSEYRSHLSTKSRELAHDQHSSDIVSQKLIDIICRISTN